LQPFSARGFVDALFPEEPVAAAGESG
jgi:hypothetical protein